MLLGHPRGSAGFSFEYIWATLFIVGARVWARKRQAEFSRSDSHRDGAEETDWECIFWPQHPCASQPCHYAARHPCPSRSEPSICTDNVLFLSHCKALVMLHSKFEWRKCLSCCCFMACRENRVLLGYSWGQGNHWAREQETVRSGSESYFSSTARHFHSVQASLHFNHNPSSHLNILWRRFCQTKTPPNLRFCPLTTFPVLLLLPRLFFPWQASSAEPAPAPEKAADNEERKASSEERTGDERDRTESPSTKTEPSAKSKESSLKQTELSGSQTSPKSEWRLIRALQTFSARLYCV